MADDNKEVKGILNYPEADKFTKTSVEADETTNPVDKNVKGVDSKAISKVQAIPDRIVPSDGKRYLQAQAEFKKVDSDKRFEFDGSYWHGRDDGNQIVFDWLGDIPPADAVVPSASA